MENDKIEAFIRKQKVAFICSVDEDGFPNVKATLNNYCLGNRFFEQIA